MTPIKVTETVGKDEKIVVSGKWEFNWQDAYSMWIGLQRYYALPILFLLNEVRNGATWEELKSAIYTIVLMQLISFYTKLRDENKYVVDKK